ncbi:CPBP family intramembrane metalloprotease [Microbacterium sp. NEAU-LLC]|uniref:CPBP family intramembrane metalloprotease n=1 Tax=Microbacterium helvum TaxID=2773713 RepID=A0ABR8NT43_9MICO|nr:CPBP family intramembrane glutamic endopeptidase [Microbacterium helvum]MBD3943800.1 CPBP family intramembrane metalloprotease [Microbacterium helvum]
MTSYRGIDAIAERYDRPVLFYVLATAIPWACWFGAAALSNLEAQTPPVQWSTAALSVAGLVAPVGVVAWLVRKRPELRADIRARLAWPRGTRPFFIVAAFLLLPASILVAQAISLLLGYSPEQFLLRGGYTFTAGLLPVWVTLLAAAVLEEFAWHGYGTDTLVRRMPVLAASLLFTVIWALWHLPLSFIDGYYHQKVVESGWLHTLNFPLSMVAFVVLMNWLYYRAGRSILIPIVFHITANFANEVFLTHPDTKLIQTALLLILAAVVVVRDRTLFLARPPARASVPRSREKVRE